MQWKVVSTAFTDKPTMFTSMFQSLSETFVIRSCSFFLLVLAMVVMRRGKEDGILLTGTRAAIH